MRAFVDHVRALPAGEPAMIVAHPLALPSADLCRAFHPGLRIAAAYLAPANLRTVHGPIALGPTEMPGWLPKFARRAIWRAGEALVLHPPALAGINAERAALGLPKVTSMLDHLERIADLSVGLWPDWFAPPQPDWPQPFVMGGFPLHDPGADATLPAGLQAFLAAGDAPLVFTHGTGNRQAAGFFAAAVEATQRLGRRAILLTPERDQLPARLPDTVWWQDYVPMARLLTNLYTTNVAALIHHGGIGTTAEALRAGVPQLVVPMAFDQFDNAARVRRLGAGHVLPIARVSGKTLANQLLRLFADPAIAPGCAAVRRHFADESGLDRAIAKIHFLISKTGKN